jgi:nucleoside-diphosphate-sugar epimerase
MTSNALSGKRVLVTGGSGFIGRHLIRALEREGARVYATCRTPDSVPSDSPAEWLSLDLAERDSILAAVQASQPDVVFHLAARLGADRSLAFSELALRENVIGTHLLLAAFLEMKTAVERIVVLGSGEEYGRSETLLITEEQPLRPVSPYSLSKAASSQLALTYAALYDLPVTVIRPFIVFGPGQSPAMMVPSLIETLASGGEFAMTKGEQTRDFLYVEDLVDGILAAASSEGAIGEAFNLCSGQEHSIRQVAETARNLIGEGTLRPGALPYRENEVWRLVGSNEKARRLLQWIPRTTLEEGLGKTIEWYRTRSDKRS